MRPLLALLLVTLPLAGRAEAPKKASLPPAASACARKVVEAGRAVVASAKPSGTTPAKPGAWLDLRAACASCASALTDKTPTATQVCKVTADIDADTSLSAGAPKPGLRRTAECDSPNCVQAREFDRRLGQTINECEPDCG